MKNLNNIISIGLSMAFTLAAVGCGSNNNAAVPVATPVAATVVTPVGATLMAGAVQAVGGVCPQGYALQSDGISCLTTGTTAGMIAPINGICQSGYILQSNNMCAPYTPYGSNYCNSFPNTQVSQNYNYGCYGAGTSLPYPSQGSPYGSCSWVFTGQSYVCYPSNGYTNGSYVSYQYGMPTQYNPYQSSYGYSSWHGCYWSPYYGLRCQ